MNAILIALAGLFLLTSPAMAGQCPSLLKQLKEEVEKVKGDDEKVKKVKALMADAYKLHEAKNHLDSVQKCDETAGILGIGLRKKRPLAK